MLETFFHPMVKSRMVRLENPSLRKKCGIALADVAQSGAANTIQDKLIDSLKKVRRY